MTYMQLHSYDRTIADWHQIFHTYFLDSQKQVYSELNWIFSENEVPTIEPIYSQVMQLGSIILYYALVLI